MSDSRINPDTRIVFFDVVETLFSLEPLDIRLAELDLPPGTAPLFFAQLLRDAFALSSTGTFYSFPEIARGTLEVLVDSLGYPVDEGGIKHVLAAFAELPAHPDVKPALEKLRESDCQAVLLTNGSRANSEKLIRTNGIEHLVDGLLSVEDVQLWKPRTELYREAALRYQCAPENAALIAAHAWDIQGALSAGMHGIWVQRQDSLYHPLMGRPDAQTPGLEEAVEAARGVLSGA